MHTLAAKVGMVALGFWGWQRVRQELGLLRDLTDQKNNPSGISPDPCLWVAVQKRGRSSFTPLCRMSRSLTPTPHRQTWAVTTQSTVRGNSRPCRDICFRVAADLTLPCCHVTPGARGRGAQPEPLEQGHILGPETTCRDRQPPTLCGSALPSPHRRTTQPGCSLKWKPLSTERALKATSLRCQHAKHCSHRVQMTMQAMPSSWSLYRGTGLLRRYRSTHSTVR